MIKIIRVLLPTMFIFGCHSESSDKKVNKDNAIKGKYLFESVGCSTCHSVSGAAMYGPALNRILNTEVVVIREGKEFSVKINREYISRSIQNPDYEKVIDFRNKKMNKPDLTNDEIECIVEYLISIQIPGS